MFKRRGVWSEGEVGIIINTIFSLAAAEFSSLGSVSTGSPTWLHLPSSGPRSRWMSRCKLHSSSWWSSSQAYTHPGSEVAGGRSSTCRCRWGTGSWRHRTRRCRWLYRGRRCSCCWKRTLSLYVLDTRKRTRQWSSAREEKKDRRQLGSTYFQGFHYSLTRG